jgi:CheY-like chemotaxis protein
MGKAFYRRRFYAVDYRSGPGYNSKREKNMNTKKKILIVDDDSVNREFFTVMLSKLGFQVEEAEDGVAALEQVKHFHPDIVILDNVMPKMSGWELTKILKGDPKFRTIPIIMFSALDDVRDKVEGFELGIDDYITKPFNFAEVLARIKMVLRNHELLGQILARESRLSLAEELSADLRKSVPGFLKSMDDLDGAVALLSGSGEGALPKQLEEIKKKAVSVRKHIAELDARIERTMSEWEDLKKNEIGIQTLETRIRTSIQDIEDHGKVRE